MSTDSTPIAFEQLALLSGRPHQGETWIRKILVPVDFSECANNALQFAIALGWHTGATIEMFHSFQLPVPTGEILPETIQEMEAEAGVRLARLNTEIVNWLRENKQAEIPINYQHRQGFAADQILNIAESEKADIIVMGTQGASGFVGNILGSITSHVIGRSKIPVLAVPLEAKVSEFDKVVYATDWSDADEHALEQLVNFAQFFDSEIHVVHIQTFGKNLTVDELDAFENNLADKLNYEKLFFHLHFPERNSVEEELQMVVDKTEGDLVAMLYKNRNFFERLFHTSLTKKMAMHSHTPVLVFHE